MDTITYYTGKSLIMTLVHLRWAYFHIHPNYTKFYMDAGKTEAHFQHKKTGHIHSNFKWVKLEGNDE